MGNDPASAAFNLIAGGIALVIVAAIILVQLIFVLGAGGNLEYCGASGLFAAFFPYLVGFGPLWGFLAFVFVANTYGSRGAAWAAAAIIAGPLLYVEVWYVEDWLSVKGSVARDFQYTSFCQFFG